ncbi:hypothetical protein AB0E12_06735 [Micromonospora chersina]|uniref:hypothetical protein n=1 Tax=Micromonospora chersina TaxID=47854 RepID=UPI0033FC9070
MSGAPAVLCAECGNDGELFDRALTVARQAWDTPVPEADVDDQVADELPEGATGDLVRLVGPGSVQLDLFDLLTG